MEWISRLLDRDQPRWFRVLDKRGNQAGLGFFCRECHYLILHDAPPVVRCCADHYVPRRIDTLEIRSLADRYMPAGVVAVGWDD